MANEKNGKTDTTKKGDVKTDKKVVVKRTAEDLKKTEEGKITLVIRTAMKLANDKGREGLPIEGKEKEGSKQLAGRMNSIIREGGKLSIMDKKGESYAKLKGLAQKAIVELKAKNYGPSVKGLLNYCLSELSASTPRVFNPAVLDGIDL